MTDPKDTKKSQGGTDPNPQHVVPSSIPAPASADPKPSTPQQK